MCLPRVCVCRVSAHRARFDKSEGGGARNSKEQVRHTSRVSMPRPPFLCCFVLRYLLTGGDHAPLFVVVVAAGAPRCRLALSWNGEATSCEGLPASLQIGLAVGLREVWQAVCLLLRRLCAIQARAESLFCEPCSHAATKLRSYVRYLPGTWLQPQQRVRGPESQQPTKCAIWLYELCTDWVDVIIDTSTNQAKTSLLERCENQSIFAPPYSRCVAELRIQWQSSRPA